MALTEKLSEDVLKQVAGQLAGLVPCVFTAAELEAGPVRLAETFPVWALTADAVARGGQPLLKLARQTGQWHHQIRIARKPVGWARSVPLGPTARSWEVREVFNGPLAGQIAEAIDWLDREVKDDSEVRLLDVPAYYTHAFWVADPAGPAGDRAVVIGGPAEATDFKTRKAYSVEDFLKQLTQLKPSLVDDKR